MLSILQHAAHLIHRERVLLTHTAPGVHCTLQLLPAWTNTRGYSTPHVESAVIEQLLVPVGPVLNFMKVLLY